MVSLLLRLSITVLLIVLLLRVTQPPIVYWHSQRDFPCQEDEVLGYSPSFGPNRVGCISLDLIPD